MKHGNMEHGNGAAALCIIGASEHKLFGLTPAERLRRQFARAGVKRIVSEAEAAQQAGPVVVVRADAVIDQPLVGILAQRIGLLLLSDDAAVSPLAVQVSPADLAAALARLRGAPHAGEFEETRSAGLKADFWKALRKRETPYALALTAGNRAAVEWRMFMGTYKGATDIVTKHLWPVPAFHVTRWLAPRGVTPNQVTLVGALLMAAAFGLFFYGHYASGLVAAWAMTFLDTVDGKLARTTLTSSKWGDVFDHGIDLVHPPFWYAAWAFGLGALAFSTPVFWWLMAAILGGYIAQRIMEGIAIKWLGLEIHIWRPADTLFRQITARRNPNLILLTAGALIGRPDWGLIAVAVWTLACLVLHGLQLAQGLAARRAGPLTSWMTGRQ